jgi:hypothetical protein
MFVHILYLFILLTQGSLALPIHGKAALAALATIASGTSALPVNGISRSARPLSPLYYISNANLEDNDKKRSGKVGKRYIKLKQRLAFLDDRYDETYPDLIDLINQVNPDPEFGPNKLITPGSTHPSYNTGILVTQNDPFFRHTCFRGVSRGRRRVSKNIKTIVGCLYSVPKDKWADYEFDHLIPLVITLANTQSLGGSNHPSNLWPQPRDERQVAKSALDHLLYNQVVAGEIDQTTAISLIYENLNKLYGLKGEYAYP